MTKLRIGIIGATGLMGRRRLQALHRHPRAAVTAISGRSTATLGEPARKARARVFTDDLELATSAEVDAVCVCVPNTRHAALIEAALRAGKHVCAEYPLVQSLAEARRLHALAQRRGLVLNHAMTVRLEAQHLALKSALPRIGRPISAHSRYFGGGRWYLDPELRGNRWLGLEIHFLDQYEDLLGMTRWLDASCIEEPGRSCGTTLVGYESGASLALEFGMGFAYRPGYAATLVGDRGYLWFERGKVGGEDGSGAFKVELPPVDPAALDTESFIAQVLDGATAACPWDQGWRAMQLALRADQSARRGRRVTVPPPNA